MVTEERFETFEEGGAPAGLVARSRVHAQGLWHRAVHVWLYDSEGRVYVQRRGAGKDINAGRWDVSVGEHLKPGETYWQAARRGLQEELRVSDSILEALGGVRRVCLDRPDQGIHDHELQQAFHAIHDGPVAPDPEEVAELRLVRPTELHAWLAQTPDDFTPGCRCDVAELPLPGLSS